MQNQNSPNIALLTGGEDKAYAFGMARAFIDAGIPFEFIGSDDLDDPFLHNNPLVVFRNIRGDQREDAPLAWKAFRIFRYYLRLLIYAVTAKPRVFHILWNSKFEWFDRTVLMLLYRLCGRKVVFTIHNVNKAERDGTDSSLNRLTLWIQYRLCNAVFVHTEKMGDALRERFRVPIGKINVIPFPVNSTPPTTDMSEAMARQRLGLNPEEKVLLFYGHIAPYKGLDYLVQSLAFLERNSGYRLLVAGRVKVNAEKYWSDIQQTLERLNLKSMVDLRIEFVPDEETEIYFKAADVLVLPYTYIFQSGVLFLGYNYGLPVLAADVGCLKESIVEGETGFVFRSRDPEDLARCIKNYFDSDLYHELTTRRKLIRDFASQRHSWSRVASTTEQVYRNLLVSTSERPLPTP